MDTDVGTQLLLPIAQVEAPMPKETLHGCRARRIQQRWMKKPFVVRPIHLQVDSAKVLITVHIDEPTLALRGI